MVSYLLIAPQSIRTPGIVWLVYATETTGLGDDYTYSCTRTRDVQFCQDDLDSLGDPLVVPNASGTWGGNKAIYRRLSAPAAR